MSAATHTLGERRHRRRIAARTAMALALVATVVALDVGPSPQAALGDDATGTVRGAAWVERDGDGLRDADEAARRGLAVSLARAADGTIAGEAQTDGDGRYAFEAIPPGTYVLVAALPEGAEPAPAPMPGDGQTVNALTRDGAIVHSGELEVTAGAVVEANAGILEPIAEESTAPATEPESEPGASTAAPSDTSSTTETTEAPTEGPTETPTTTTADGTTEPSEPTTVPTTATVPPTSTTAPEVGVGSAATSTALLPAPTIVSDKADYPPGGTVVLRGTNWLPLDTVTINVSDDEGKVSEKDVTVHASANGEIMYTFVLPNQFIANYAVTAVGSDGRTATTTFTDQNPSADLDQSANGPAPSPNTNGCSTIAASWVNGNLNQNTSLYLEGDSVPYRIVGDDVSIGPTHTVVIEWDTMQQGKHAIDFITSFNRTVADANPCLGVANCGAATTFPIPVDSAAGGFQIPGVLTMYGGVITAAVYSSPPGNDAPRRLTITFTNTQLNPVLAWGGHIATRVDWGFGNSAASISGSPFHTRLIDLDGSGGNQDRSLSAAAVIFPATITIIKDAIPNAATTFPFTATGPEMTPTSFNLVDDGVNAALRTTTYSSLITFGTTRTVTEGPVPSGWTLSNLTCGVTAPDGTAVGTVLPNGPGSGPTATFELLEANTAVCTFTNIQQGSVAIVKDTVPNGPADFSFTVSNAATPASFTLDNDADPTLSNSQVLTGLVDGQSYVVTETSANQAGFSLTGLACTGGGDDTTVGPGGVATIGFDAGETIVCTFTNTQQGSVEIIKDTAPNGPADFSFTATNSTTPAIPPTPAGFALDDDADPALPNSQLLAGLVDGQSYVVTETSANQAGFSLTGLACTGGGDDTTVGPGGVATIGFDAGETIVCTFTNTQQGSVEIIKDTAPNGPADFAFTATNGANPAGFSLDDDAGPGLSNSQLLTGLVDGQTYVITETTANAAGFTLTGLVCTGDLDGDTTVDIPGGVATIGFDAGETITCTFTNTQQAILVLEKVWSGPADNQSAVDLSITGVRGTFPGRSTNDSNLDNDTVAVGSVLVGETVTLAEVFDPPARAAFYDATLFCGQSIPLIDHTGSLLIPPSAADTTITCTFTNTRKWAEMTLRKTWVDAAAGDTANLSIDGAPPVPASATGVPGPEFPTAVATAIVYAGTEVALSETLTGSGSYDTTLACVPDLGELTYVAGERTGTYSVPTLPTNVVCTFTNTRQRATLTLQKTWVDGAAGDTANLSINGGPPVTATATGAAGPETSPNVATATVLAGATVTLTEALAGAGSYGSTLECGGTPITLTGLTGTYIVPSPPANVTCTFTNTRRQAILTLQKTWVDGAANDTATLSINGGPPPASATATATGAAGAETSPNTATATIFAGATVTLSEVLVGAGSYTSALVCGGTPITLTGLTGTYTVPATPTNVTCTFTNTRQRATLTLQKTWVDGAAGDTANLSINGGPPVTATATGAAGPVTSPNTATATVLSGSAVTLSEVLAGVGSYMSTLECGGTPITLTGLTGNYTVPAPAANVTCTFTNTRTRATLTLQKTWVNGAAGATADLSINGGPPVAAPATGVLGPYTSPNTATAVVLSGALVTLSEVLGGVGSYNSALECGGTVIPLVGLTGIYTVPALPADVVCTFTNTRRLAVLTLQKVWVDGAAGDTANLSIEDGTPVTATATGVAGPETSPDVATASVFSGATVTLTEALAGTGSYTSTLDCGGTPIPLVGLSGNYIVPSPPADVTCTFTNTRQRATLTLQKTWVDGAAGDTATLSINGGPPPATTTATATGAAGSETSPNAASATVLSGSLVTLSEVLAGTGAYTSTLECGGTPITLTGLTGTYTVPAPATNVVCTFTNTRQRATLTLQKTWVDGAAGDTANLSINGGPPPAAAIATATGAPGSETSTNVATATVLSGATVSLTEALAGTGSYASTLECGGTPITLTGLTGTYNVPAPATNVVCTFTNTRARATLTLQKTWINGAAGATADLSINGGPPVSAPGTGVLGPYTSPDTATAVVFSGALVTLSEVLGGVGSYNSALDCGGTVIPLVGLSGTYTVPVAPTNVTCTFTNTRRLARLTLQKVWVDGAAGDTATLSINGGPPPATATATATGAAGSETSPNTATASVFSGSLVTLTEVLGGVGSYTTTLDCGGTPIMLTGLRGTYTVPSPPPATDVVCTFTNTRQRATLTLQKTWVDGAANDTATLSINGGPPPASATATATGTPGTETSPNTATATVLSGATVTLTEILGGTGSYTSTLDCGGTVIPLVGLSGSYAVPAPAADVTCTFTNTRQRATLTLQKTWVDAAPGDTATLSIDGGPPPASATATATGAAGQETSPDTATATVLSGATVTLAEVLGGTGSYTSTLDCGGTAIPLTGLTGTYIVPALPADVTCAFTNTRLRATLTLQKTWVDGAAGDTANLSINGGPPPASATATATGAAGAETSPNTATATILSGANVVLAEVLGGIGSYTSTLDCGGTAIPLTGLTGTYTVPATPTNVVCTFTNTRQRATLTLQKTWVNAAPGDTANLSINGGPPVTAFASGNVGPETSPDKATATVLSGTAVTLAEVLGGIGSYDSVLDCGGTLIPLTGLTGSYTVPATPADVLCTFTNTRQQATLTLQKAWVTPVPGDTADLTVTGVLGSNTVTATAPDPAATPASLTVLTGETALLGEVLTGATAYATDLTCVGNTGALTHAPNAPTGTLGITAADAGDTIACTFTNRAPRGTIVIVKNVEGANGTFDFTGSWLTPPPFSITTAGGTGSQTTTGVLAGTYTVTETDPSPNYDGTGLMCTDPDGGSAPAQRATVLTGTIDLDDGETVTCTFTNTQRSTIVVVKEARPESATVFGFTGDLGSFTLVDDGTATNTFASLPLAANTPRRITETVPPGWTFDADASNCSNADTFDATGVTVTPAPGTTVTCTFVNVADPGGLAITKIVSSPPAPNADGTYTLAYDVAVSNIGLGPTAYTLTDVFAVAPGVAVTQVTTVNLTPGTIPTNPSFDGAANTIVATANLAGGVTDTYRVTVTANVAAVAGGPAAFDCSLQPGETGTGFLNRAQVNPTAEACAPIPYADVAVTKQVDQSSVMFESDSEAPARLTYTLVITNRGPAPSVSTVLEDDLPTGVTYVSAVPSVGSCSPVGTTTIRCPLGTMAVGAVVTIMVTGDLSSQADGTITNTARVSAATIDPDMTNNVGVAGTSVRRQGGAIPITGAQVRSALIIGAVLLTGGWLLVLFGRRRRRVPTA